MVFRPARRRPPVMASPAPSAETGSGLTASASSPSAMIFPEVCARQRPGADRGAGDRGADGKAAPASARRMTICSSARSPPNRWAQPVMSRKSPCGGSSATSGVKRSHQSAMSSSVLRSATSSASNTVSSGQIARALASGRPIERPERAARSSSAIDQQRVVLLGDDDAGGVHSSAALSVR